jgi:hypothetical protein
MVLHVSRVRLILNLNNSYIHLRLGLVSDLLVRYSDRVVDCCLYAVFSVAEVRGERAESPESTPYIFPFVVVSRQNVQ